MWSSVRPIRENPLFLSSFLGVYISRCLKSAASSCYRRYKGFILNSHTKRLHFTYKQIPLKPRPTLNLKKHLLLPLAHLVLLELDCLLWTKNHILLTKPPLEQEIRMEWNWKTNEHQNEGLSGLLSFLLDVFFIPAWMRFAVSSQVHSILKGRC